MSLGCSRYSGSACIRTFHVRAEAVEVVDVQSAEKRLQRVVDIA